MQTWQDADRVVVGTKCNALLRLDVRSGAAEAIPRPPAPARAFSTENAAWGSCGVHSVAFNPAGDLLATGGADPADGVVLRAADWAPVATLVGHRDWVFGVAWASDRHLVTGSRDGTVALWAVDAAAAAPGAAALPPQAHVVQEYDWHDGRQMRRKGAGRVRDVRALPGGGLVAALSTEGAVRLLDPGRELAVVRALALGAEREHVALAASAALVAAGSLSAATLVDPRKRDPAAFVATLQSPDPAHGVRSLALTDRLLSFGTGRGLVCIWDLRAGRYVPSAAAAAPGAPPRAALRAPAPGSAAEPAALLRAAAARGGPALRGRVAAPAPGAAASLRLGAGWVERNATFWGQFHHLRAGGTLQACYAHAWCPAGTRLFAGGGPLAFGLKGGYLALWE